MIEGKPRSMEEIERDMEFFDRKDEFGRPIIWADKRLSDLVHEKIQRQIIDKLERGRCK